MALSLSALDYGQARRLYSLLSYGSLVLLFLVMLWRARGMAIVIVPLPLLLMVCSPCTAWVAILPMHQAILSVSLR